MAFTKPNSRTALSSHVSKLMLLGALLGFTQAEAMPVNVPAKIQAEDYSNYLDLSTGNNGGAYRNDNVDIQATNDADGGFNVGWIEAQEWLEYEIQVPQTGAYTLDVRASSATTGGGFQVQVDGANVGGKQTVANTGSWQNFNTQTIELGTLSAGSHAIRLEATGGGFNLNWLEFKSLAAGTTVAVPGRIEAENYQRFFDTSPGNTGGALRQDDVDLALANDVGGGHLVGWISNGEWLEFDVDVAQAGNYDIDLRVATASNGAAVGFAIDGNAAGQGVGVPNTRAWDNWTTVTTSLGQLPAGKHSLRVNMVGTSFNLNWLDLRPSQAANNAGDQCDFTSECKAIYGNAATDCKNSKSEQSICMCGNAPCSDNPAPNPDPQPDPDPQPQPDPDPTPQPGGDQCDTTAQCKAAYGNSATDCKDSRSEQSICMCGNAPCSGNPAPNPDPDPDPTPNPTPGTGTLGKFDKSKDLFLAFYDNKPDADDIHSQAGVATLLKDRRFNGVNFYAVLGTYGKQNAAFLNSNTVMNQCYGASNWSNAHPKDGPNWTASLNRVQSRVQNALSAGGDIWIMEAGQSDFTADLVRRLKNSNSNINTKNRIHVVQHSQWNEDQTTPADLSYTRANTDYNKIPDGNSGNNGSPQLRSSNGSRWSTATSIPGVGACWAEARRVADAENFSGNGHYENPAIEAGGFDFSDVVEATWIFGFNSLRNHNSFFDEFPK